MIPLKHEFIHYSLADYMQMRSKKLKCIRPDLWPAFVSCGSERGPRESTSGTGTSGTAGGAENTDINGHSTKQQQKPHRNGFNLGTPLRLSTFNLPRF